MSALHGLPLEEARRVDRPENDPWTFSGPINALISDSYPLGAGRNWTGFIDALQRMIEALYKNGYVIAQVAPDEGEGRAEP